MSCWSSLSVLLLQKLLLKKLLISFGFLFTYLLSAFCGRWKLCVGSDHRAVFRVSDLVSLSHSNGKLYVLWSFEAWRDEMWLQAECVEDFFCDAKRFRQEWQTNLPIFEWDFIVTSQNNCCCSEVYLQVFLMKLFKKCNLLSNLQKKCNLVNQISLQLLIKIFKECAFNVKNLFIG